MSNACIVPFFKYEPSARGKYKILFNYFVRHLRLWASKIDHLYIIDSGSGLNSNDKTILNSICNNTVYSVGADSHWGNLNKFLPMIKEDKFLLIDSDTIISDAAFVDRLFANLDTCDIVSMTDASGGIDVFKQFPIFDANKYRDVRRRFAPYLFACKTEFFKKIGTFDFTPLTGTAWTDSMGAVTTQLLQLNPSFIEIPDDRGSIYYIDGEHKTSAFLDNSRFEWSQNHKNNYGYYHIRNFNGGLYLVESRALNRKAYDHAKSIMPRQEAFRLLAWLWLMTDDEAYKAEIFSVAADFGVNSSEFLLYIASVTEFHDWVGKIP